MYYWFAAAVALAGMGADPAPLMPSSKWIVDYQDNACVVSRSFGPPPGSTQMGFEPNMARDGGRLILISPRKVGDISRHGTARIALLPSGEKLTSGFTAGLIKDQLGVVMTIPKQDIDAFMAAITISVDLGPGQPIVLHTRGMTGTLQALQACQDDLAKKWGVDPADRIPADDMPNFALWFSGSSAYPTGAIWSGSQGRTVALVTIRNDGKVETCRTVAKSGTEALDKRTCEIAMKTGRFPKVERDPKAPLRWTLLPVVWVMAS